MGRVVFNSRGAFASVNHFHFHGLYLENCGFGYQKESPGGIRLPLELVQRQKCYLLNNDEMFVEVIEHRYFLGAFVWTAPVSALPLLAKAVWPVVESMQRRNLPHNLVFRPLLGERQPDHRVELFLVPGRQQRHHDVAAAGYNAAIMEVSGFLVSQTQDTFDSLTEEQVIARMRAGVALQG